MAVEPRSRRAWLLMSKGWVRCLGLEWRGIAGRGFFVEGEAVDHAGQRVSGLQQAMPDQARGGGGLGLGQTLQIGADDFLRRLVDGGVDLQIEPVEVVQARFAQ